MNRALSTPYNTSETQDEDGGIDIYKPEDEVQGGVVWILGGGRGTATCSCT